MLQLGRTRQFFALITLVALAACGGSDDSTAPSQNTGPLNVVIAANSTGQTAAAGTKLPFPIAVTVVNSSAAPQAGIAVTWEVLGAGGSVSAANTVTDQNGFTFVDWTLGDVAGTDSVRASISGGNSVIFTAKATKN
ncbi:MAG TPA: hypothetical protein VGP95_12650 [Gemmatimonadaceae bacterium]|nr:hypothetical protein [Gemmatimonadaceae bacterium]